MTNEFEKQKMIKGNKPSQKECNPKCYLVSFRVLMTRHYFIHMNVIKFFTIHKIPVFKIIRGRSKCAEESGVIRIDVLLLI